MNNKKDVIENVTLLITDKYKNIKLFNKDENKILPSRAEIINMLKDLRTVLFPGYFCRDQISGSFPEFHIGYRMSYLFDSLRKQICLALRYNNIDSSKLSTEITSRFFERLPEIQELLLKDVDAAFNGDPAANSKEEIIFSYPGLFAIYVYRLANLLYNESVPFIPRIMSEYAHGKTGIDINPGAKIGEYFFIDHGTGVVIGETTIIGNNVKIYQGVTLGALSTRKGQELSNIKRHPTIKDNVTIYSNSTVLGGETVIGENTVIGGNTFITSSIPANSKVSCKSPEFVIKAPHKNNKCCWDGEADFK